MDLIDCLVTCSTILPCEHQGIIPRRAIKDKTLASRESEKETGTFLLEPKKAFCVIYLDFITACIQLHQRLVIFIELLVKGMTNIIIYLKKKKSLLYNMV